MSRLEKLPDRVEARLPEIRDEWIRIGLSTEPAKRVEAERGVDEAYAAAGLKSLKIKIWFDSPFEGVIGAYFLSKVRDKVGDKVRDKVRYKVWDKVWDKVWAKVGAKVWDKVWAKVRDKFGDKVWDKVRDKVGSVIYGQHDAGWFSFYDVFRECGLECVSRLDGLTRVAKSAGWWWAFEDAVILTERPNSISLLDGVLHNETGPALSYPDGFSLWSLRGVSVDDQIVMRPETQTVSQIRKETNEEVKRVRIERFGWQRYLTEIEAVVIDHRRNDVEATKESLMRTPDGEVVLVAACPSTARVYEMEVGKNVKTCQEAQLWRSGGLSDRIIHAS